MKEDWMHSMITWQG